jgi:hypothetical protein
MTDTPSSEGAAFMAAGRAKIVALSGDGQPKAAVPTKSSDQLFLK